MTETVHKTFVDRQLVPIPHQDHSITAEMGSWMLLKESLKTCQKTPEEGDWSLLKLWL